MNIILASASPRRKEILENASVKFEVMASCIEELTLDGESPCQMVMRLAFEKGMDIASRKKSDLIISADTIVVIDNTVLGKPENEIEARKMITSLSGRTHQVITGISLINLDNNKKIIDYVISNVKFKNLSEEDINDYTYKQSLERIREFIKMEIQSQKEAGNTDFMDITDEYINNATPDELDSLYIKVMQTVGFER